MAIEQKIPAPRADVITNVSIESSIPADTRTGDFFDLKHRSALGPATHGFFSPGNSSTSPDTGGMWSFASVVDASSTSTTDADGTFFRQTTTAVSSNSAYVLKRWPWVKGTSLGKATYKVKLPGAGDITDVLVFFGESDDFASSLTSDTLVDDGIGFQFSTSRGDTTWKFITNAGGSQTTTDTGVTVAADDALTFDFDQYKDEYADWWIRRDGTVIASGRVTTNIPNGGGSGNGVMVLTTKAASAKNIYWYPAEAVGYNDVA